MNAAAADNGAPLLSVRDLSVVHSRRGTSIPLQAVRSASFDLANGEIFALVGESGSGKSSLAHTILQLHRAAAGTIDFRGSRLGQGRGRSRSTRRHIQAVFQDPLASLSPRRTIGQSLLEPLHHFKLGAKGERLERAAAALENVGLGTELFNRYPAELSGGQRQRVALARAIAPGPKLIVADEPLSSLDMRVRSRIVDLIGELRERLGIAFLFISHDLTVVRQLADTVAVMYLGRFMEVAPAQELFSRPAHPYTRSLLNAAPVADPAHPPPQVLGGEAPSALTPPPGCVFHERCPERVQGCATEEPADRAGANCQNHRARCHLWES